MKRTLYTHWRGHTVYTPQGIPLAAFMAASRRVVVALMPPDMARRGYKVRPVVLCHPRYFRVKGNK